MVITAPALDVRPVARMLKALGDDTRVRIVALLSHQELCVCHIEEALDLTQSNASRQLGILRAAGVVETRREKNWVYYRLAPQSDELCKGLLGVLTRGFAKRNTLRRDVQRLRRIKGPMSCA